MIKVLNVYARFHVYMYINMCLYILLIYLLLSYFPHFFVFVEVDISFIWFLSGKSLGLSLCELNNLLNIYLLGKVKTCIVWCKKVMNSRVVFLISVQKKWLYIFFIWYFTISTWTFLCTHYLETAVYGFNRVYMQHIGDSST